MAPKNASRQGERRVRKDRPSCPRKKEKKIEGIDATLTEFATGSYSQEILLERKEFHQHRVLIAPLEFTDLQSGSAYRFMARHSWERLVETLSH